MGFAEIELIQGRQLQPPFWGIFVGAFLIRENETCIVDRLRAINNNPSAPD